MRIVIVDTYYPDVLKALPFDPAASYEENLRVILGYGFATADFYSRHLQSEGWRTVDLIANHQQLQELWCKENHIPGRQDFDKTIENMVLRQIGHYDPDVLFLQDLSVLPDSTLRYLRTPERCDPGYQANKMPMIAAQLSCPWPGDEAVRHCDVIFTSFPHYVPRIENLGVKAVYNPLAFEPSVIRETFDRWHGRGVWKEFKPGPMPIIHDCVFIGGVGNPSHWKYGMQVLELVAREIPTFKWWGYGVETLPADSILRQKYQGQAFGLDMYEILLQSKIVMNRHGEVAEGYSNNMRMYEATGCGALLVTEEGKNIWNLFSGGEVVTYLTPHDAVEKIKHYLMHEDEREFIAQNGQRRTLRDHTYAKRMATVAKVLEGALVA